MNLLNRNFILLLCTIFHLFAGVNSRSKFEKYHTLSLSTTPIKLDDASYEDLTSVLRDYSTIVLLTAQDPRFGCQLCREFEPEWDLIGKSWIKGDKRGTTRVLYGTLDFGDGKETFQKLMLQTAPVLLLFPPNTGPNAKSDGQVVRYDFTMGFQTAEQVYEWITRQLPPGNNPPLKRPFNFLRLLALTTILSGLLTFVSVASPYIFPVVQNRNFWAAVSLITILLFTSGHMFNHIRKVPYVSGDGKGGISYFASGFSNQYGLETQIIAAIYGLLSFSTIALALKVPRISDPKGQKVAVLAWGALLLLVYSFLLNVFRIKNGGYPFFLPPF